MMSSLNNRKQSFRIILVLLVVAIWVTGTAFAGGDVEGHAEEGLVEAHAEGHGEVHSKQWDHKLSTGERDWTDTFRVMNFAVLAIGLFFLLRKPVSQALNGRIEGIKTELEDLEIKKKEAEKKLAQYNEQIDALDKEAEKIVAEYKKQGEAARDRILEESKKAAAKLEEQAKRTIENEFKNAKLKLQKDILEKALTKAEELVKNRITSDDQDRLVDEYLDKVVA